MVTEEIQYVVVERISRKKERQPVETLHLAEADSGTCRAICGRDFDNRTMIPLSSWGKPDRIWCDECRRASEATHPRTMARRRQRHEDRCGRSDLEPSAGTVEE